MSVLFLFKYPKLIWEVMNEVGQRVLNKKKGWLSTFQSIWKVLNAELKADRATSKRGQTTAQLQKEEERSRYFKKRTADHATSKRGRPTPRLQREDGWPRYFKERTADHVTSKRGWTRIEEPSEQRFFEIKELLAWNIVVVTRTNCLHMSI